MNMMELFESVETEYLDALVERGLLVKTGRHYNLSEHTIDKLLDDAISYNDMHRGDRYGLTPVTFLYIIAANAFHNRQINQESHQISDEESVLLNKFIEYLKVSSNGEVLMGLLVDIEDAWEGRNLATTYGG